MRLSPTLAGLILAGCSLGADPAPTVQLDPMNVPDVAALAAKIQSTFNNVKLTGNPRVSPVRKVGDVAGERWPAGQDPHE